MQCGRCPERSAGACLGWHWAPCGEPGEGPPGGEGAAFPGLPHGRLQAGQLGNVPF